MPYDDLWEGRSPNAADAYRRMSEAGEAPDNSWLSRLFGQRREAAGPPAPAPVSSDEGRFAGPSPFSPPPPAPKPASKLTSASDIAKRISSMIGAANEPQPVSNADFGLPPSEYAHPDADVLAAALNQIPNAAEPPPPRVPIDMREPPSASPFTSASLAGLPDSIKPAVAELLGGGNKFGGNKFGGQRFGGNTYGGRQFGASAKDEVLPSLLAAALGSGPFGAMDRASRGLNLPDDEVPAGGYEHSRSPELPPYSNTLPYFQVPLPKYDIHGMPYAEGGDVPDFMRGGYPELRTAPIRRFDSGGQTYVDGDGDGRADDVDARLSSGEYVLPAEDMALLGNGNPKAGAKRMDEFRANVRKHKGKALAKGKFSPNAKNPAEYLTSSPISDGIRRLGRNK